MKLAYCKKCPDKPVLAIGDFNPKYGPSHVAGEEKHEGADVGVIDIGKAPKKPAEDLNAYIKRLSGQFKDQMK